MTLHLLIIYMTIKMLKNRLKHGFGLMGQKSVF